MCLDQYTLNVQVLPTLAIAIQTASTLHRVTRTLKQEQYFRSSRETAGRTELRPFPQ